MGDRLREIAGGYGHISQECGECGSINCAGHELDPDEPPLWCNKEESLMAKKKLTKKKLTKKQIYKITAVDCDWKDRYLADHLNQSIKFTGEGTKFVDVEETNCDAYVIICANPPITSKQAQKLYDVGSFHVCDYHEGTMNEIIDKLRKMTEADDYEEPDCPCDGEQ